MATIFEIYKMRGLQHCAWFFNFCILLTLCPHLADEVFSRIDWLVQRATCHYGIAARALPQLFGQGVVTECFLRNQVHPGNPLILQLSKMTLWPQCEVNLRSLCCRCLWLYCNTSTLSHSTLSLFGHQMLMLSYVGPDSWGKYLQL